MRFVDFYQDSSAKDRWIGAYSIGPTFMGKLSRPIIIIIIRRRVVIYKSLDEHSFTIFSPCGTQTLDLDIVRRCSTTVLPLLANF
jgi:hypothetical protein